jgi:iron complex outermembrane receptor protein
MLATASASALAVPAAAFAQAANQQAAAAVPAQTSDHPAGSAELQEIVVTAQRREQSVQKAAAPISAVRGRELEARGVTTVDALTQVLPALNATASVGAFEVFSVRGVQGHQTNEFGDPAVAVYDDGTYLPRPTSAHGLFYDLDRVELLKGPQGTLYGRNSVAGALNVISQAPVLGQFSGELGADVGNYDLAKINAMVNIPLGQDAAIRIAAQDIDRAGYFSDGTSDDHTKSARFSLLWEPTDATKVDLRVNYVNIGGEGGGETAYCVQDASNPALAGCPATGRFYGNPQTGFRDQAAALYPAAFPYWTTFSFPDGGPPSGLLASSPPTVKPRLRADNWGVTLQIDQRLFGGTLSIIPTYRHETLYMLTSQGGSLIEQDHTDQETLEARFTSPENQRISYILGAFYSNDQHPGVALYDQQGTANPFGLPSGSIQIQHTNVNSGESYAAYGTATLHLSDTLRLTGGLRYTDDEKTLHATAGSLPFFPLTSIPQNIHNLPVQVLSGPGPLVGPNGYLEFVSPTLGALDGQESFFHTDSTHSWASLDWRIGVEWNVAPRSLLYATIATGYKAGGFFVAPNGYNDTYQPEHLTAYTVGSKNRFFDNRLQLNAEAFYWDYRDQQVGSVRFIDPAGAFVGLPLGNAQQSTIYGAELDSSFLATPTILLSADVQFQKGRYDKYNTSFAFFNPQPQCKVTGPEVGGNIPYDCSGLPLLNQPEWIATVSVQKTIPLENGADLVLEADGRYEDQQLLGYTLYEKIGSDTTGNASLTYRSPSRKWNAEAYVNNISNAQVPTVIGPAFNSSGTYTASLRPPRTYGLRITVDF